MIDVIVSNMFPYESIDPENPGTVHGCMILGKFYCSQEAFDRLRGDARFVLNTDQMRLLGCLRKEGP